MSRLDLDYKSWMRFKDGMCPRRLYGPNRAVNPGLQFRWCIDLGFDPFSIGPIERCSQYAHKDKCWKRWSKDYSGRVRNVYGKPLPGKDRSNHRG
jgi:hypothetical protein